jgi:hypothetical protein
MDIHALVPEGTHRLFFCAVDIEYLLHAHKFEDHPDLLRHPAQLQVAAFGLQFP